MIIIIIVIIIIIYTLKITALIALGQWVKDL